MDTESIWLSIIVPIIIGPLFIFFKSIYDNYNKNKTDHQLLVYNNEHDKLDNILNKFYWKFYIKLLCINKLYYNIPLKNDYEYESDNEDTFDLIHIVITNILANII